MSPPIQNTGTNSTLTCSDQVVPLDLAHIVDANRDSELDVLTLNYQYFSFDNQEPCVLTSRYWQLYYGYLDESGKNAVVMNPMFSIDKETKSAIPIQAHGYKLNFGEENFTVGESYSVASAQQECTLVDIPVLQPRDSNSVGLDLDSFENRELNVEVLSGEGAHQVTGDELRPKETLSPEVQEVHLLYYCQANKTNDARLLEMSLYEYLTESQ